MESVYDAKTLEWLQNHPGVEVTVVQCTTCGKFYLAELDHECSGPKEEETVSESIISNEKVCFICGTTLNLHRHHVFHQRGNRDVSEREGCWCYLCMRHHDDYSKDSVHNNPPFQIMLQKFTQKLWEDKNGGSRERFIETFGRSYL